MPRTPAFPARLLDKTATVYGEDAASGRYTVVARADLPVMLGIVNPGGARTSEERAELSQLRTLLWTADYGLPEHAQVEIDGQRWNVVAGSLNVVVWPATGAVVYRCADVLRVK